ncbi:hypothetical protein [Embleya sp. NBC_00896]|uniref:hypothetical protein n=1 Tax=Embleya sp. NBC_00896 TaxID=2975961 RepID=UPI002F90C157|nr:hypothetical protein OG928_45140 [Embleya sp. NBC_00896]
MANLEPVFAARDPCGREQRCVEALPAAFPEPRPILEGVLACGLPRLAALEPVHRLVWRQLLVIDRNAPLLSESLARAAREDR